MHTIQEAMIDTDRAFEYAIDTGRLCLDETSPRYVRCYMYMGKSRVGRDLFKHINTRQYLD